MHVLTVSDLGWEPSLTGHAEDLIWIGLTFVVYWGCMICRKAETRTPRRKTLPSLLVLSILLLLYAFPPFVILAKTIYFISVIAMVLHVVWIEGSLVSRSQPRPQRMLHICRFIIERLLLATILIIVATGYFFSAMHFYPGSYPERVKNQLHMIYRILYSGQESGFASLPETLSNVHYFYEGKDMIPDSIRERGTYDGYRYILAESDEIVTREMDVLPYPYIKGEPSFKVYAQKSGDYVSYLVSMADSGGEPASRKDRLPGDKRLLRWGWEVIRFR